MKIAQASKSRGKYHLQPCIFPYDEGNRFKQTGPHIFQEGDIVELQISFIVVPLRDQKSRMNVILRSATLLEGKFTQVR